MTALLCKIRVLRLIVLASVVAYIWSINFNFFETRGFGGDHIYYRELLASSDFNVFLIKYISEGATEPLSAVFLYSISLLPLDEDFKFFFARLFIFLLFIGGCRSSDKLFYFGAIVYLTPLMQTLFQSNLRQGFSVALIVSLLPLWRSAIPFFIGALAHTGSFVVLLLRMISNNTYFLVLALFGSVLALGLIQFLPSDISNTLAIKVAARTKLTGVEKFGYVAHPIIILSIYLISNSRSFFRLDKKALWVCILALTLLMTLLPFNDVARRLIPFFWFLPIYTIYRNSNLRNVEIMFAMTLVYFIAMWIKTI